MPRGAWAPVSSELEHPLAILDGRETAGGLLRVLLGPTSRFGARYFAVMVEHESLGPGSDPALIGLQRSGPLPSYNWIEVAHTNERPALPNGDSVDLGPEGVARIFALFLSVIPPGGHLMVEYDSPQRAETARALALGVPPIATPLGELLFRLGYAARFKDWQIAEGGSEGPRKLQAYHAPSEEQAHRWQHEARQELDVFLRSSQHGSEIVQSARRRAVGLLPLLSGEASR